MAGEIRFTMSEQDCVDAVRDQYRHRAFSLREWRGTLVIIAALGALMGYVESCDLRSALYGGVANIALLLACLILIAAGVYFCTGIYARRLFRQQRLHPDTRISWTAEGVRSESQFGSFAAAWNDFYGWRSLSRSYVLLVNGTVSYVIPRHAVSPEQAMDLEETLTRSGLPKR